MDKKGKSAREWKIGLAYFDANSEANGLESFKTWFRYDRTCHYCQPSGSSSSGFQKTVVWFFRDLIWAFWKSFTAVNAHKTVNNQNKA